MVTVLSLPLGVIAQVNSGSDGHDGALDIGGFGGPPVVIDMADHPDGIYHYTSVNISAGARVTFTRNSSGTPVVWLVQGNCVINGTVDVSGQSAVGSLGGAGGPGGFAGGNGGVAASAGQGPGAGAFGGIAASASYGTVATPWADHTDGLGSVYGSQYVLPLLGGSGGGGNTSGAPGGGGGGAILIAASQDIALNGVILAAGGSGGNTGFGGGLPSDNYGGAGSGGAIRLVATRILGDGRLDASGGVVGVLGIPSSIGSGGLGRVRMDGMNIGFGGQVVGVFSQGFQPIIIPPPNQAVSLAIQSVGGFAVAANTTASLTTPDVVVPANQQNPVLIVVRAANIPLNSEITVEVKPANGPTISAVGINNAGTQASSTATVSVNIPRGGGTIQAKATSGIAGTLGASLNRSQKYRSYADTGLTSDGERFAKVEVNATLGSGQQIAYLAESGKRYPIPAR